MAFMSHVTVRMRFSSKSYGWPLWARTHKSLSGSSLVQMLYRRKKRGSRGKNSMSEGASFHQHDGAGGDHTCLFCGATYHCTMMHESPHDSVRQGARCCPSCRNINLRSIARWEDRRRQALYDQ